MVLCPTFASLAYGNKKKETRRERFLVEMNEVTPWEELLKIEDRAPGKLGFCN